jgi:hypothetical protein
MQRWLFDRYQQLHSSKLNNESFLQPLIPNFILPSETKPEDKVQSPKALKNFQQIVGLLNEFAYFTPIPDAMLSSTTSINPQLGS